MGPSASWFRALVDRFGGKKGYTLDDLRSVTAELVGKSDGDASHVFSDAFLGGDRLNLDDLFSALQIDCDQSGKCTLGALPDDQATMRTKLFSATP